MPNPGLTDSAASPVGGLEVVQDTHDDLNANANIQVDDTDVSAANPVNTLDSWRADLQSDETADDSDKTFTVPASTEWQILWIWVELTTTATVGDRQIVIEIQDSGADVIGQVRAGAVQAASLTRYYMFGSALADLVVFRDTDYLMTPLPPIVLEAGDIVRIYDNNAVAAAADDMIVQMQIAARTV